MKHMYDPITKEVFWQKFWEDKKYFQSTAQKTPQKNSKRYLLFAFAYPSGSGLHVGHVESKTALDIMARFYRMNGEDVYFPVGWDAFGLPAENYAIKTGIPPVQTTKDAINTFRRQIKRIGISYDWDSEVATSHPEYYKWTQWIFIQLFKKGMAYQATGMVNWCPSCQTVLANEQVVNGACERCDSTIQQKELKQWYFKITQYQDELISGLQEVDWPEPTKLQQLHWIGKSSGVKVTFSVADSQVKLDCFTTRIDTIAGVSFLVISPEKYRELDLNQLVAPEKQSAVEKYVEQAFQKTEEMRKVGEKDKTGVDTGLKVVNPVTLQAVPVYVADYVLAGYGTGVVMGVPAHDERDMAFAQTHGLPVIQVIEPIDQLKKDQVAKDIVKGQAYSDYGVLVGSEEFSGLKSQEAQEKIVAQHADTMQTMTHYKLRDWLISRQRYWGAPIPIVYDPEGNPHPVKDEHLPWLLPTDVEFKPTGESPLKGSKEFIQRTEQLYGKGWRPEFDTMDTFVDSSWYFLRYCDPRNTQEFASKQKLAEWLPVDMYMIGPEHIVLHLLYSRFFTKFLSDEGYFEAREPFAKMRHQGMILGPDSKKMSKSKGNVINPDDVIEKYGADTLRVYEMFMGPLEADKPWDVSAVIGVYKFLQRVHKLVTTSLEKVSEESDKEVVKALHQTLKKVTEDVPLLKFNTAIARLMQTVNIWEEAQKKGTGLSTSDCLIFVKIMAIFAPFLAEELWSEFKQKEESVHLASWPTYNPEWIKETEVTYAIQVNGKVRGELVWPANEAESEALKETAAQVSGVARHLEGKDIKKVIVVPDKIVNFVVS